MKPIVLFLFLSLSLIAEPNWIHSYDDALQKAQLENKRVIVMLSQESCPGCNYMKDVVFEDDELVARTSENFVWLYIDIKKDRVPQGLRYRGTPTFHFIDQNGKKFYLLEGYANELDFALAVDKALDAYTAKKK